METFKPIAMKFTQEQFEAIRPKLRGLKITNISPLPDYNYLVNNLWGELKLISNIPDHYKGSHNRKVYEEWNEKTFLKFCGIGTEPNLQHIEKEFDLSMCRIIVDNQEQSKKLQELAFKQGFNWSLAGKIVLEKHARVLYFNSETYRITYSNLSFDDSNFKTFHFTDVFKETLQEKAIRLENELNEVKQQIEDSKIKIGDFIYYNNGSTKGVDKVINIDSLSTYKYSTHFCLYKESEVKKITNKELINKLNELYD